ncbi:MAG: AAA family ATPase [Patescibacteria group bacterium]
MHLLNRLELVGFKSFASKTVLDFPAGITSIVGPNGSGKSNVIDALRWLLGEREAKNIRGAKAEDLIFAGTPERTRSGMAQATIVFDNSSHFFPVDYSEVSITRKIDRGGASEYLLNEAEVRLKDLIDFFAKSRLGTKGFTIVNQGNSDIFVKASGQERREMIEEVLGLRQFQLKKHEAENKLKSTKINLDKVEAMVREILPHLKLLRRQTAKWEKHADLEKELREIEEQYFSRKLGDIENDLKGLEPQLEKANGTIRSLSRELKELQSELAKVDKSGPRGDKNFQDFKKQQSDFLSKKAVLQNGIGRLEAQIEILASQPKSEIKAAEATRFLEETHESIKNALGENDLSALKALLRAIAGKIERILSAGADDRSGKIKELEKQKEELLSDLKSADEELLKLSKSEADLAEELRGFNAIFKKSFELVEAKKDEINKLENEKNKILFEKERVEIRRQELDNLARQAGRSLKEFQAQSHQIDLEDSEKKMFKIRGELAGIGDLDPALIKEAQDTEGRYNFLSSQSEDLKKASEDLAKLIEDLDEKIHSEFNSALKSINDEFNKYFKLLFEGGHAKLTLAKKEKKPKTEADEIESKELAGEMEKIISDEDSEHKFDHGGIEISVGIPRKKISGLEMLSGGERSLVSVAVLFALISVSPPPFLVLDEVDAPLDERNARRFADLIKQFASKTQFIVVTHNRATMESADILYGVTMGSDGTSKVLSVKLENI